MRTVIARLKKKEKQAIELKKIYNRYLTNELKY